MKTIIQHNQIAVAFISRIFLGLLFFFQGYDAVFKVGIKNEIETFQRPFLNKGIPHILN
jgi:uncharacterized membrane protein YphA (DoxX/SURF4 family)